MFATATSTVVPPTELQIPATVTTLIFNNNHNVNNLICELHYVHYVLHDVYLELVVQFVAMWTKTY